MIFIRLFYWQKAYAGLKANVGLKVFGELNALDETEIDLVV